MNGTADPTEVSILDMKDEPTTTQQALLAALYAWVELEEEKAYADLSNSGQWYSLIGHQWSALLRCYTRGDRSQELQHASRLAALALGNLQRIHWEMRPDKEVPDGV